jgi:phosphoglycolate phosphatase-like HAD superfamily hydrolase
MAALQMSNLILEQKGYQERFTEAQCRELYGKKWREYFEALLPYESSERHSELQEACFSFSMAHPEIIIKYIRPVDHSHEVLEAVGRKHDQILISHTKPTSLPVFMEAVGITRFFSKGKAFATDAHSKYGTKFEAFEGYQRSKKFDEIIVVGDSANDVLLGKKIGAKTFLYSHPGQPFKPCEPDHRINDLREVLREV